MATGLGWLRRSSRTRGDHVEDRTLTRQNVPPAMLAQTSGAATVNASTALTIADAFSCIYAASEVVYVRRAEIELELDRSRLFNSDQSELRAKLRGALVTPNPTAVVRILGVTP